MKNPILHTPPKHALRTIEPLDLLPFVGRTKDDQCRDFWQIKPSGDYGQEFRQGAEYASQFVEYLSCYKQRYILGWIVRDMIQHGNITGLELGFMGYISGVVCNVEGCSSYAKT